MRKKANNKFKVVLAALLAALTLCSCTGRPISSGGAAWSAVRGLARLIDSEDSSGETARFDGGGNIRFADMQYTRPELDTLRGDVEAAESALDSGESADAVIELLDVCYEDYYAFSTMYTLAEIRYLLDMSDEYYEEEYGFCSDSYSAVQQLMERLYSACARSKLADKLEESYFWEGFVEEYGEGAELSYSDEAVALMQRESELLGEYYALGVSPVIELDGENVDLSDYLAEADAEEYSAALTEYYRQYNPRFAEIYIELVKTRRALALKMGYESYEQMQYASYERDYSVADAEAFTADVKEYIVPLYEELMALEPYNAVEYYYMSEERLLDAVGGTMEKIGGAADEAFDFMENGELYDVQSGENKADMSFTVYLDSYSAPFAFVTPYTDTEDILTLSHEFGHFLDAYYNYNAYESLDLSEFFSEGMEYLALLYSKDELDEDEYASLQRIKMLDALELYVSQTAYAEFESRVYAMDDEALTAEALNLLSLELAKDYGYYDGVSEDYYALSWFDVTHFFESPFYVISYPVANAAAFGIYELELSSPGAGLDKYNELLPRNYTSLIESLDSAGLESPFAAGRVEKIAAGLRAALAELSIAA